VRIGRGRHPPDMIRMIFAGLIACALLTGCVNPDAPAHPARVVIDSEATMLFNADRQLSPGDSRVLIVHRAVVYCTAVLHHLTDEQGMEIAFDHPGTPMPAGLAHVQAIKEFTVAARDLICALVRKHERSTLS